MNRDLSMLGRGPCRRRCRAYRAVHRQRGDHHPEEGLQKDTTAASAVEATRPDPVTVTLAALRSSLRNGLPALAVGAGLQVVDR